MNLKYQRDIYFLLITIILFVVGFAVPIDQKDEIGLNVSTANSIS